VAKRAQHGRPARYVVHRRRDDPAHDPATEPLNDLNGDYALVFLVADGEFGQQVGQGVWIEQRFDYIAPGGDETSDPIGEVVGKAMRLKGIVKLT
jgi:hypothetical protein